MHSIPQHHSDKFCTGKHLSHFQKKIDLVITTQGTVRTKVRKKTKKKGLIWRSFRYGEANTAVWGEMEQDHSSQLWRWNHVSMEPCFCRTEETCVTATPKVTQNNKTGSPGYLETPVAKSVRRLVYILGPFQMTLQWNTYLLCGDVMLTNSFGWKKRRMLREREMRTCRKRKWREGWVQEWLGTKKPKAD